MRKILAIIITCSLLANPVILMSAVDQDLSISGKTKLLNLRPKIALDPNGNALVVWDQNNSKNNDYGHIYAAYLKRNADGTYALQHMQRISEGTGSNHRPDAVYMPKARKFFIVWDNGPFRLFAGGPDAQQEALYDKATNILGRPFDPAMIATADSCVGEIRTVAYGGHEAAVRPLLTQLPANLETPGEANAEFGLLYSGMPIPDKTSPACFEQPSVMIWMTILYYLQCGGTVIKISKTLAEKKGFVEFLFFAANFLYFSLVDFAGESAAEFATEFFIYSVVMAFLSSTGPADVPAGEAMPAGVKSISLGKRPGSYRGAFATALPLTTKKIAAISNYNEELNGEVCSFGNKLTKMKDLGCPAKGKSAKITHATLAKLSGDTMSVSPDPAKASDVWAVYRLENGDIRARNLKTNGKATGNEIALFSAKDNFRGMAAKGFGNELLVAWVDQVKKKKTEIKLKVVSVQ